jgi:hypothetical protein
MDWFLPFWFFSKAGSEHSYNFSPQIKTENFLHENNPPNSRVVTTAVNIL